MVDEDLELGNLSISCHSVNLYKTCHQYGLSHMLDHLRHPFWS